MTSWERPSWVGLIMGNRESLHEAVTAVLAAEGFQFMVEEEESLIRLDIQGDNGYWMCLVQCREEQRQILFYGVCPAKPRPDKVGTLAELLTRINYQMAVGCFEMDYDSGQVRLRTAVNLGETAPETTLIKEALEANVLIMDGYLPAIMAVLHGDLSPVEALDGG